MPNIVTERSYGGAEERVKRLGLAPLLNEIRSIVTGFDLRVLEKKDANGGAAVRKLLDARFEGSEGWTKVTSGDVDWSKCKTVNGTQVCIGVEVQFSARSDLLVIDLIHLRRAITKGAIDVGVLIVPTDRLGSFLTDRAPRLTDAIRHIEEARVQDLPLILVALEHDAPGPALSKQVKKG